MFAKNILALLPTHGENLVTICVIISFIALLMLILLIKGHRHISKAAIVSILPVLIVSGYPFIWYFVMYKHSLVHATLFTYHDLMITTFGLFAVFFYLIREDKRPDEKTISKMGSN